LLVEDHADSAFFIKMMLENIGYRVLLATDLKSALELFQSQTVDLIVSDLGLPDGRSTELMKTISRMRPTPAIALSGYGMESDIQDSLQAGFAIHLTKPIDFEKLASALKSLEASLAKNG
jgi:CheY-like chemotaxis protein